jgi:hypothetical protein
MAQHRESKDDQQSVITLDRLKRFNEVHGIVAGNAIEEVAAKDHAVTAPDVLEAEAEAEAAAVQFEDIDVAAAEEDREALAAEERDEVLSRALGALSVASKQSKRSNVTSKTYISKLEKQLEVEKVARLKLEQEVEEMKKINAEISSKLGLSNASANDSPTPNK